MLCCFFAVKAFSSRAGYGEVAPKVSPCSAGRCYTQLAGLATDHSFLTSTAWFQNLLSHCLPSSRGSVPTASVWYLELDWRSSLGRHLGWFHTEWGSLSGPLPWVKDCPQSWNAGDPECKTSVYVSLQETRPTWTGESLLMTVWVLREWLQINSPNPFYW